MRRCYGRVLCRPPTAETKPANLILKRVDPERNMRRYHLVTVQHDCFSRGALITEFGRIGQASQVRVGRFLEVLSSVAVQKTGSSRD